MPNYRRARSAGGTFFFTVVTHGRRRWLCSDAARAALRAAIGDVRGRYPFSVDAWVLLPDHLHCLWTLPDGDPDYGTRWRLIKTGVTRRVSGDGASPAGTHPTGGAGLGGASALRTHAAGVVDAFGPMTASRERRNEQGLWQRRFWEHTIRDERDFAAHCDYLHYNPVKHGLAVAPKDWPWSTLHRFVAQGLYPKDWGAEPVALDVGVGRE